MEVLLGLDGNILLWIQEYIRNDFLTPFFVFITKLGDVGMIWIVLTLVFVCNKKTRKAGVISAVALLLSLLFCNVLLKNLVQRVRPYEVIDTLTILVERQKDFSFPSGHTSASFAAGIVFFRNLPRKFGVPAVILACLISFSRLYIGVHYPTDVICSIVLGGVLAFLSEQLYRKILRR